MCAGAFEAHKTPHIPTSFLVVLSLNLVVKADCGAGSVAGVLWRRHMKTLTTTFLSGNSGMQSHPLFQWFAERSKQHIRCLAAPHCVEFLF
jgi:hypothetical protein